MSWHARIIITPKKDILDPAGEAVKKALARNGLSGDPEVRIGKVIDVYFQTTESEQARKEQLEELAHSILRNPIMESMSIEYEDASSWGNQ